MPPAARALPRAERADPWRSPHDTEGSTATLKLAPGLRLAPGQLLMMLAKSDSMAPTIMQASPFIVQRGARPECDGSGIYVLRFGGDHTVVRRVTRAVDAVTSERDTWRLICDNERYGDECISGVELAEAACIGRVVFVAPL